MRPWIGYHEALSASLAELVGAAETEVVAMNSLTVNLHLMMVTFFRPSGPRNRILIEKSAFPSDRYAVISQLEYHGLERGRAPDRDRAPARRARIAHRGLERGDRAGRSTPRAPRCCPACST